MSALKAYEPYSHRAPGDLIIDFLKTLGVEWFITETPGRWPFSFTVTICTSERLTDEAKGVIRKIFYDYVPVSFLVRVGFANVKH